MFPSAPFIGQITLISIASSELGARKWKSNQKISYEPSKSTWCTVIVYATHKLKQVSTYCLTEKT